MVKTPPDAETLRRLWRTSDVALDDFFNKRGKLFKEQDLQDKLAEKSAEEKLDMLSAEGKLIKRPIVSDGQKVTLGFKQDEFAEVWGK